MNHFNHPHLDPEHQRSAACLGLAYAAGVHVAVVAEHVQEAGPTEGVFFAVLAVAELVVALAVIARRSRPVLRAALVLSAATVTLWLVSRTLGLPGTPWTAGGTEPVGVVDASATAGELLTGALVLVALVRGGRTRR